MAAAHLCFVLDGLFCFLPFCVVVCFFFFKYLPLLIISSIFGFWNVLTILVMTVITSWWKRPPALGFKCYWQCNFSICISLNCGWSQLNILVCPPVELPQELCLKLTDSKCYFYLRKFYDFIVYFKLKQYVGFFLMVKEQKINTPSGWDKDIS